jgi:hypothetical protein
MACVRHGSGGACLPSYKQTYVRLRGRADRAHRAPHRHGCFTAASAARGRPADAGRSGSSPGARRDGACVRRRPRRAGLPNDPDAGLWSDVNRPEPFRAAAQPYCAPGLFRTLCVLTARTGHISTGSGSMLWRIVGALNACSHVHTVVACESVARETVAGDRGSGDGPGGSRFPWRARAGRCELRSAGSRSKSGVLEEHRGASEEPGRGAAGATTPPDAARRATATTRSQRPSAAAATRGQRPSTAATTRSQRPSTAAATRGQRPSTAPATRGQRPSTAAAACGQRPSTAAATRSQRPSASAAGDP